MENTKTPSVQNVSHLERQFREKLYELQNNTDTLQLMQKELLETRHALYSTKLQLEKERGVSHELKMQLKAAMDRVNKLEQQRAENQIKCVQLQVKYDAMSKQYDSLMNQASNTKMWETEYKMKVRNLEENLRQKDATNERLGQMLKDLECNNLHTINVIDHNIAKLAQEHRWLVKSCEAIVSLNQRLQTVGLCTYVIHEKDTTKINNLERMLVSQPPIGNVASGNVYSKK
ncbi:PREDICTED: uncharacterized protein LOC106744061 [Dinoponera quadriceps]|uniref:Uncharacterized protein LOC106744061 n=1 Tax=Dinoponera quadriceps TaxID=609295 RepID=A0A6P3X6E7_DINQU|nr:PREDICTED: uncharacterized protein LOC106744061 [Dinoponera quadriceps]XP_014473957.1 PREDICTED: uncharacterized protein LOC106744061 [Dinoponera quadriceps]XP_014473958.1 PREDICTED: uncharacterized protein LOC106744061 [Dinoponera quadriceps]XP_014473959.1 PREDICTED: uncharacterized protein LOC106744061 [Dinoponera quadriceps]